MAPGAAEIETLDGRAVSLRARNRPQHQHLVDGQLGMVPVAESGAGRERDVLRQQQLPRANLCSQTGDGAIERLNGEIDEAVAGSLLAELGYEVST